MLRKIEKNAKSEQEALALAAEEFGVPVSELSYKVEREVGKGLMGFLLGKEVIISAWLTKEAEEEEKIKKIAEARAQSTAAESGANPYAPKVLPQTKDYVEGGVRKKAKKQQGSVKPAVESEPAENKPAEKLTQPQNTESEAVREKLPKKNREVTEKSIEDAKFFATELIHKMGLTDAEITSSNGGDCVSVNVSGSKMGLLIGKRGDTLESVQYLTNLYVNREKNSHIKVTVDTENYRAKREETLVKFAKSLERRVIRENKPITLEPMVPNERRIIHSALQNSTRVKTYSVGEGQGRKIVIDLK